MKIGQRYQENKEALVEKIKSGEGISILDLNTEEFKVSPICYFCDISIRGYFKLLIEASEDNRIIERCFLHARCYKDCLEQEFFAA